LTKVVVHRESAWRDEPEDLNSVIRAYTQGERLTPVLRAVEGARLAEPGARDVFPWTRLDNASLADFGRLDSENKILNAENRSLDAELQRLRADNLSVDAELQRLRADNLSVDAELQRLRADNLSVDAELQRLRADNLSVDAELQRLRVENKSLDAELQRLNRERKDSTVELYRVDTERERLRVDLAALSEELAPLKQRLSESTGEIDTLREVLAAREDELVTHKRALSESAGEIDTLREVLAAREDELVTHKRALSESAGEIDTLREVLTAREDELVTLKQALSKSSGEIDTQRRALTKYGAKVDEMRATISALEASTSWRITWPMRAAKHLLGQLRYSVIGYVLTVSFRALRRRSLVPLRHWRDARVIARSGLFDRRWYFENNPDVAVWRINPIHHYIEHGAAEGRNPNLSFDTCTYLSSNPDVGAAGVNPFAHYLLYGAAEKRQPYCSAEDRTERSENTSSLGFSTLVGKSLLQVAFPVWRRLPLSAIHKQRLASIAYTVAGPLFEGFAGYDAWRANSTRPLKRVAPEPATLATRCPEDHIEGLELSSDGHPLVSHPIRRRHT
jgi:predicted  nucleic acid-binding Zn-ribbon protein